MKSAYEALRREADALQSKMGDLVFDTHHLMHLVVCEAVADVQGLIAYDKNIVIEHELTSNLLRRAMTGYSQEFQITNTVWFAIADRGREISNWLELKGWAWFMGGYYSLRYRIGCDNLVLGLTGFLRYVFSALNNVRGYNFHVDLLVRKEGGAILPELPDHIAGGTKGVLALDWLPKGKGGE